MKLLLQNIKELDRSYYLYLPQGEPRTAFKRSSVTILRDENDEASVLKLLLGAGLAKLAEEKELLLVFPNPVGGGWNYSLDPSKRDDVSDLSRIQGLIGSREYGCGFHPMNDSKYIAGTGSGASMALTYAAMDPQFVAAVLSVGGAIPQNAADMSKNAPVPAYLVNSDEPTAGFFSKHCQATQKTSETGRVYYRCSYNPTQCVIAEKRAGNKLSEALMRDAWNEMFAVTRRPNTNLGGDVERRIKREDYEFETFIDDTRLGDNGGMPHTWFTHVPRSVKANPDKKVPLMIFGHGGSDNPSEAADMSKFHELGEKEGFITVYPWASNKFAFQVDLKPELPSDVDFYAAIIAYMIKNYPVDSTRVYVSGFSNGASMAHCFGMVRPDLVAAICPIDTMWPPVNTNPGPTPYKPMKLEDVNAFHVGRETKKKYDYRMPVWYTYGGREVEYPAVNHSGQQAQYDFWKEFNNITIKPTPGRDNPNPSGVGVDGDKIEELAPNPRHPDHKYTVHRFYSNDEGHPNYYNYVMMHNKSHDVAAYDPTLGWNYVKQFRRNPDGSLGLVE